MSWHCFWLKHDGRIEEVDTKKYLELRDGGVNHRLVATSEENIFLEGAWLTFSEVERIKKLGEASE